MIFLPPTTLLHCLIRPPPSPPPHSPSPASLVDILAVLVSVLVPTLDTANIFLLLERKTNKYMQAISKLQQNNTGEEFQIKLYN